MGCVLRLKSEPGLQKSAQPVADLLVMHQLALKMAAAVLRPLQGESLGAEHRPAMHGEPRHFRVELQSKGIAAVTTGLIFEGLAARAKAVAPVGSEKPSRCQ